MGYIKASFLGKEHSIPEDILIYIELLGLTDSAKNQLVNTFVRKLKDEIRKDNIGLIGDEDLAPEVERQVSRFIAKLCDNGIFSRTINDYWKNNKGYQLYSDVNKAALEKMKSILLRKLDDMQAGYEHAINKAESHVTGMGFSILSGSFINHAVYAAMEASTINKQTKEAEAQYQRDMSDLRSRLSSQYGGEQSQYINGTYIPNMEAALTVFAYELLDKYVADLVANGKFDGKTLDYVDISRSNDLLKNLALSANKKAIIESAFVACPYNTAVYMQAIKHDLLDYDSLQTAKVFKQGDTILSFLKENCGEVSFPTRFSINYYCAGLLASLTGKTPEDYLRVHTEQYATGIVKAYARVAEMISDKDRCRKVMGEYKENAILESDSICHQKARSYVNPIAPDSIWDQLTEQCGQKDLLKRIKKYIPQDIAIASKADADKYFTEQLIAVFEVARKGLSDEIIRKRQEEEERRKEELRRKQEAERIREEKRQKQVETNRKAFKVLTKVIAGLLAVVIVYFAVLFVNDTVISPAKQYKAAIALMEAGDYPSARDIFVSLDGYKDSGSMIEQCNDAELDAAYNSAVQMMEKKEYTQAIRAFESFNGYKDSDDYLIECRYLIDKGTYTEAIELIQNEEYEEAIDILLTLEDFESSAKYLKAARYGSALQLMENNKYTESINLFNILGNYEDSREKLKEAQHGYALQLLDAEQFEDSLSVLAELSDYAPAQNSIYECRYQLAMKYISQYDYRSARILLESIAGYKDASSYKKLLDGIISKVYYNDEYYGTHYIWVVSKIDIETCTEKLYFYKCRDDFGWDDEFVDYSQGHSIQWKTSGTTIFASSDGQEVENGYTRYNLSPGRNILTSQYISTDGEAKVVDTYKLMPDGRAQCIKEEWATYLKNNESDDTWQVAVATIDFIDHSSNVEKTSDGIAFYVNGLKWNMPNGWKAKLNSNSTAALVTFSEGEFWGDVHRIYISYEGQYTSLIDYMNVNQTNSTFRRIIVDGCSEAYICYEGLLDENDFESSTAYVICKGSVFKISYVADETWYIETQGKGVLSNADFAAYSFE